MKVLGIVTARGGSKGLPGKNIWPLLGRPLLAWTAESALAARRLDRVILSTDDEQIAQAGREAGLDVPFLRPPELARDDTRHLPVLQHALREAEQTDGRYDAIFILQPTNPLRTADDIDGSLELLERTGADSVHSFAPVGDAHPAKLVTVDEEGRIEKAFFQDLPPGTPRQELPEYHFVVGLVYAIRREVLMEQNDLRGADCRAWLVPEERAINIDTELDFFLTEQTLRWLRRDCS